MLALVYDIMADFFPTETLKILTNAHAVRGRPTPKDVERQFRNGSFHESLESQKNSNETRMNSNGQRFLQGVTDI